MQEPPVFSDGRLCAIIQRPDLAHKEMCSLVRWVLKSMGPFAESLAEFAKVIYAHLIANPPTPHGDPFHKLRLYIIMHILGMVPEAVDRMKATYNTERVAQHRKTSMEVFFECLPAWIEEDQKSNFSSFAPTATSQAMVVQIIDGRVKTMIDIVMYGQSDPEKSTPPS